MPAMSSLDHVRRYIAIVLVALVLIIPSVLIMSGPVENTSNAEPTRPPGSPLDIAIDGIEVVRNSQSNNVYPGQTVKVRVKLIHDDRPVPSSTPITQALGNGFTTILVIDDQHDNVTTQYKTVTSMGLQYTGEDPIGSGGPNPPLVVEFDFQVPSKKPEGVTTWANFQYMMTSTITVDDDDKSDNYRVGSGLRISEPEFEPVIWEEGQKEGETIGPIWEAGVGDPLDIPFILKNDGPAVDDIGIDILQAPPGWVVGGFEPITVYPNDEEELTMFMQIPSNPFLAKSDEVYNIVVRAFSNFFPLGPYPSDSTHTFRVKINFKPGVKIEPVMDQGSNYLEPGRTHNINFKVTNTGNGKDTYTLNALLDEVHVKKGWKVSKPNPMMVDLDPSNSKLVTVKLTIPEDAAKFYNVNVFVSGTSSKSGGTYERMGEPMLIFASTRYAADIETPRAGGYLVEPGRENQIKFNFTNMGNDKDPNQRVEVDRKPIGWAVYIDMTPIISSNGVGPRTTVMLTMTVFVTETTYTTEWVSRPKVVIKAFGGPFDHELDMETFEFRIPPRQKIELTSPEPEKEGFIGGQVDFIVNVRNAGNWLDSFNLTVDSPWAKLEEDSITISPDDSFPIKVSVNIPKDAAADTNPDTPFPNDPEKNWYDGYKIRISGYSQNETSKGDTLEVLQLILHVQPFYDFEMEVDPEENPLKFSTDHDQNRAVRVRINNTGNIADLIRLDWKDNPYDWLRLQNTYIDLPDDEAAYAVLNINPKRGDVSETGFINVTLIGYSKKDPEQELKFELDLSLEFYKMAFSYAGIQMNGEDMPPTATGILGNTYSFQVTLSNTGSTELHPQRFDRLFVVLYDGPFEVDRANISYLPVGDEKEVNFAFTLATPGPHKLLFKLEGDIPISDEGDKEIQRTLIIPPPPERDPDNDPTLPLWAILIPVILLILFVTLILVFAVKYNQIYISPIDTGYDEDGEYKPWAIKEKFKEEEKKELEPPEEKEALPAPSKPGLPPAPQTKQGATPQPSQPPRPAQMPPRAQQMQMGTPQQAKPPIPGQGQPMRPPVPQGARPPMQQQAGPRPPVPLVARPPMPGQGQPMRPPVPQGARPPMQQQAGPRPPVNPPKPGQ